MEGGSSIQDRDSTELSDETSQENSCYFLFCHPRGTLHRFIALAFMCFLGFGSYFCYDNPAALEERIEQDLNITTSEYMWLYSIYSWPNVVLCFIGGFLIDRVFGIRLGTNLYMGLTLIGQLLVALGSYVDQFWLMIVGRFIFGIGAESLAVAQNNYAVLWFKGKELNMVFGLLLSFARVGSTVNFLVMGHIYDWVHNKYTGPEGLGVVFMISTFTIVISLFCSLVLGAMDKRAERITNRRPAASGDVVRLMDVIDFKNTFWLVTLICVAYYIAIFPFISLAEEFFIKRFHKSKDEANTISSLVYLISGIASPVVGFLIDRVGKNIVWITIAIAGAAFSHILLGFTMVNPYLGMVIMGLSYSTLAGSLWPLVAMIIPEYQLGTAYGMCQAFQNLGLAVIAIVAGQIAQNFGYSALEMFFIASLITAFGAGISLWLLDRMQNGILNLTPWQRHCHQQSQLAAQVLEREKLLSAEVSTDVSLDDPLHSHGVELPD